MDGGFNAAQMLGVGGMDSDEDLTAVEGA